MKLHVVFVQAACASALASVGGNALSLPGSRMVGHYDFGYAIRGDRAARPAQVFDDGEGKIYFEARPGQPMPAVFAGRELELLVTQSEGQFFTARTGASEFTLALGAARATVARGDAALGGEAPGAVGAASAGRLLASAAPGLPAGVRFDAAGAGGASDPTASSYATPVRGDVIEWVEPGVEHTQPVVFAAGSALPGADVRTALAALAVRIGHDATVVVEGRGDASHKEGLAEARAAAVREILVARGLAADSVRVRTASDVDDDAASGPGRHVGSVIRWTSPPRPHRAPAAFDILASDADIAGVLRRWAAACGYEVAWEVDWKAPVTGPAHLDAGSFTEAVEQVVAGLRAQGYPVRAQAYANRVVRFSHPESMP